MKETNKKEFRGEQKLYTALIGLGICALAVVTVIYGLQNRRTTDLVEQKIQLGEDNPVSGPVAKTEKEEEKTETEPESTTETVREKEKTTETIHMTAGYDGKENLPWPVAGNVIIPYSMDTTVYFETLDQYQCNPALYIKAEKGTEIKAVFGGTVSSVTKSDRYGNVITVDMGNGYKMSYGQLSDIPYKKGDVVSGGSVLGKIAEPTDYFMLEGSHLYMKMTLNGKEVNPTEYLES